jgi:hypothetical protein
MKHVNLSRRGFYQEKGKVSEKRFLGKCKENRWEWLRSIRMKARLE